MVLKSIKTIQHKKRNRGIRNEARKGIIIYEINNEKNQNKIVSKYFV